MAVINCLYVGVFISGVCFAIIYFSSHIYFSSFVSACGKLCFVIVAFSGIFAVC